jgi:hypothetical protein
MSKDIILDAYIMDILSSYPDQSREAIEQEIDSYQDKHPLWLQITLENFKSQLITEAKNDYLENRINMEYGLNETTIQTIEEREI